MAMTTNITGGDSTNQVRHYTAGDYPALRAARQSMQYTVRRSSKFFALHARLAQAYELCANLERLLERKAPFTWLRRVARELEKAVDSCIAWYLYESALGISPGPPIDRVLALIKANAHAIGYLPRTKACKSIDELQIWLYSAQLKPYTDRIHTVALDMVKDENEEEERLRKAEEEAYRDWWEKYQKNNTHPYGR